MRARPSIKKRTQTTMRARRTRATKLLEQWAHENSSVEFILVLSEGNPLVWLGSVTHDITEGEFNFASGDMQVPLRIDHWMDLQVNSIRGFAESIYVRTNRGSRLKFTLRRLAPENPNALSQAEAQLRNWAKTKTQVTINVVHGFCASLYLGTIEELREGDFRVAGNDAMGLFHFVPRLCRSAEIQRDDDGTRVLMMMGGGAGCSLEITDYVDEPKTALARLHVLPGARVN